MRSEVFIGSSKDRLDIARVIREGLQGYATCVVWDEADWNPGSSAFDNLLTFLDRYDFGVFVLSPDDLSNLHGQPSWRPRDNVVFELGLFTGRLGKERSFLVAPWGEKDFHLPTDLLGIHRPSYDANEYKRPDHNLRSVFGPACRLIGENIKRRGPRLGSLVYIVNKNSGQCMEVLGSRSMDDDVPIQQHAILLRVA
jgi:predicted nucleotide-binding protein